MRTSRKLAIVAALTLLFVPAVTTGTSYADSREEQCEVAQNEDCKETRRAFQTRFFSQ